MLGEDFHPQMCKLSPLLVRPAYKGHSMWHNDDYSDTSVWNSVSGLTEVTRGKCIGYLGAGPSQ